MANTTTVDKVKIPNFAYPFERKSNAVTKTKSDQEIFEEKLFQTQETQYLFNKSGLWHGGVHLKAKKFNTDFEVEGIRAIADGKVIAYKLDSEYLKNKVAEKTILYNSSFMLLEHEMAYPASNKLRFYSLYMHMAPVSEYKLEEIEYVIMGAGPNYARKKALNANNKHDGEPSVKLGDVVTLKKAIVTGTKTYEVDKHNGVALAGTTVHTSNLERLFKTTVKGNSAYLQHKYKKERAKDSDGHEILLAAGTEISIGVKKNTSRYRVYAVGEDKRSDFVSIYSGDIETEPTTTSDSETKKNGLITKDMKTDSFETLNPPIEVKAGDILGKLGLYNNEWREDKKDKVVHLEVFTIEPIDKLKTFIGKVETEYAIAVSSLSAEKKKVRPKENRIYVPSKRKDESIVRYGKEDYVYAKITFVDENGEEGDWLRDKTITNPANDKTFNVLRVHNVKQKIKKDAIVRINPKQRSDKRYNVISVEEGDTDVQSVVSLDSAEKWSVWHGSIEIVHKFHELPKEAEYFYLTVFEPFKSDKILKDKDGEEYQQVTNLYGSDIYVKKDKVVKTHGITFSNFELIDKDATSSAKAGIFEDMEAFKDPESDKTQQEKEKLNKLFADILKKIKVDKDESGGLEAGELAGRSLTQPKRDELSHFIVEHKSEWSTDNEERKKVMLLQKKLADKMEEGDAKTTAQDEAKMTNERIETLGFWGASNPDLTFIHPIALVEGFVDGCNCDIPITPAILESIFPNSSVLRRQEVSTAINKYCNEFEINTLDRMAHFLGQIGTETGQLNSLYENYRYGATAIYNTFLRKVTYPHPTQAGKYTFKYHDLIEGYNADCLTCPHQGGNYGHNRDVSNPIAFNRNSHGIAEWTAAQFLSLYSIKNEYIRNTALFDYVYGCRMGNGAKPTEDGSDYFGVGFIHMTGKSKYVNLNTIWNQRYPDDNKDFLGDDVSLLKTDVDVAMKAAMIHWSLVENINNIAINDTNPTVRAVTRAVNGGTNGLNDRVTYTATAYRVLRENF